MGVLTDYFRAPDGAAVERAMRLDTASPLGRDPGFDGVAFNGLDEVVVLGKLVAAITGDEWASDLTGSVPVYPSASAPKGGEWAGLPDDSPWVTGPWVTELGEATRQALASLDPSAIPGVAAGWAAAEEFDGHLDPVAAAQMVAELHGLARRAEEAGERLYCWAGVCGPADGGPAEDGPADGGPADDRPDVHSGRTVAGGPPGNAGGPPE